MKDNKSAYNAGIYDEHIVNVLPYYREYHDQVIDIVRNLGTRCGGIPDHDRKALGTS